MLTKRDLLTGLRKFAQFVITEVDRALEPPKREVPIPTQDELKREAEYLEKLRAMGRRQGTASHNSRLTPDQIGKQMLEQLEYKQAKYGPEKVIELLQDLTQKK